MVVAGGLDVPVAAAARRLEGARALVGEGACDTLVLDDGFAHRALKRDLDIVVLRGERPLGSGHLLPWGSLREPRSGLRRAGVLWFHHKGEGAADVPAWVQAEFPETPVVVSRARPTAPRDLDGAEAPLLGERALVVTGIAHPAPFEAAVRRAGAEVVGVKFFRDHHAFDHADVEALLALQATEGASQIVVTPKDAIKLKHLWPDHPLTVLGTQVEVLEGEELLAQKIHEITT
jgi:tetraacyldisaccharide 4'-kinase